MSNSPSFHLRCLALLLLPGALGACSSASQAQLDTYQADVANPDMMQHDSPNSDLAPLHDANEPDHDSLAGDTATDHDASPLELQKLCPILPPGPLPLSDLVPSPILVFAWANPDVVQNKTYVGQEIPASIAEPFAQMMLDVGWEQDADNPSILLRFHGGAELFADFVETCKQPSAPLGGGYYILSQRTSDAHEIIVLYSDDLGAFYAMKTIRQLFGPNSIRPAAILDFPRAKVRGAWDGTLASPWSHQTRLEIISELANLKYNAFLFGPRNHPLVNSPWDQPRSEQDLEELAELLENAKTNNIELSVALYAGSPCRFGSDAYMTGVIENLVTLYSMGVSTVVLDFSQASTELAPDDAQTYSSFYEALEDFLLRLAGRLETSAPGLTLTLLPPAFYTSHPDFAQAVAPLAMKLHGTFSIGWSGPDSVSNAITKADAEAMTTQLGEAPLLLDNYPTNDPFALEKGEGYLHLGPLTGRDKWLLELLPAIYFNLGPEAFASLLPAATAADYLWNPEAYNPDRSAAKTALLFAGPEAAAAMELLMQNSFSPLLAPSAAPKLEQQLQLFWKAFQEGNPQALDNRVASLDEIFFTPFSNASPTLSASHLVHPKVLAQIKLHADTMRQYGENAAIALDLLVAKWKSLPVDPASLQTLQSNYTVLSAPGSALPTGYIMLDFLAKTLTTLAPEAN